MIISGTLSRYLAKSYLMNMLFIMIVLLAIIYLFDTVELLRRASKRDDVPLSLVLQMGLLKLPEVGQVIFPFSILYSAIYSFWQLTRRHELIVVRSAGFSVWQFLAPILCVAAAVGLLQIMVINPIGAALLSKFERLENTHLIHRKSHIALFKEGLWLRQIQNDGYAILHAESVAMPGWELKEVTALFFDSEDNFMQRLDAPKARLNDGVWSFQNVSINNPPNESESKPVYTLPTELTVREIEESFASPETISFWKLPSFVSTMETTGFDATRLKIHFHTLLAQPLLFMSMVLLAAAVSLKPPRFRGIITMISTGVLIGFVVFFMSSFLQALGASHQIPIILASWAPALVTFLLGITVMLNMEDG
jgi:lipopolysaccharide export system permease protein